MDSPNRDDYSRDDLSSRADEFQGNPELNTVNEPTEIEDFKAERLANPPEACSSFDFFPTDHHKKIIPINAQTQCCKSPRVPSMPPFFYAQQHQASKEEPASKRFCRKSPILAFSNRGVDHTGIDHALKSENIKHAVNHETGCCAFLHPMATNSQILHYRVHRKNNTHMAPMVSLKDRARNRVPTKKRRKLDKQQSEQSPSPTQRQPPSPAPRTSVNRQPSNPDYRQQTRDSGERTPPYYRRSSIEIPQTPPNSRQTSHPSSRPSNQSGYPYNIPENRRQNFYPDSTPPSGRGTVPNSQATSQPPSRTTSRPVNRPDIRLSSPVANNPSRSISKENTGLDSPRHNYSYTRDDPHETTSQDIPQHPTDSTSLNPTPQRRQPQHRRDSNDSFPSKRDQSVEPSFSRIDDPDSHDDSKDPIIYGRGFGFLPDRTIINSRSVNHTSKKDTRRKASGNQNPVVSTVESQFQDYRPQ